MYCPRRFGLLEIENAWVENVSVVLANIMHENVHSGKHQFKSNNKVVLSSVTLYNDELDLYGVADCIEFCKNKDGVPIDGLDGKYTVRLVEYKPTQPKDGSIRETTRYRCLLKNCVRTIFGNATVRGTYIMPIQENV